MKKKFAWISIILLLFIENTILCGQSLVSEKAKRHLDAGVNAFQEKKYALSIKEFDLTAKLAPEWPDAYFNLGVVQEKVGKFTDAIKNLQQYLRLAPDASDVETVKSKIDELRGKLFIFQAARGHFDRGMKAVEMAKSNNDYAAAIYEFKQAARLAPDWPDVYYNLGKVQEIVEKFNDAGNSFRQYLRLAPDADDAEEAKTLIIKPEYAGINANTQPSKTPPGINAITQPSYTPEDINAKGSYGLTQLHRAARDGKKDVADLLIAKGAEINAKDKNGITPLHYAARLGHKEVAELLLAKGADINAKDQFGETPMHEAVANGQKEMAELLIAKGADIYAKNKDGITPLGLAAANGQTDMAALLIAKGAKINATEDNIGSMALHWAAGNGQKAVAELLIAKGANVNPRNNNNDTPLHIAAWNGKTAVAGLLITKGADINAKNNLGNTPLQLAESKNYKDMADLLRKHGASIESKKMVKSSIAKGADMNARSASNDSPADMKARDEHALTPLFVAVRDRDMEMVKRLIEEGADVNGMFLTDGGTPLTLAAEKGYEDVAELLISEGADINATDKKGFSPLQVAVLSDQKGVVELLIAKGADINSTDNNGVTPLHFAVRTSHTDIVKLLIAKGAEINAKSRDGSSPLHEINSIDPGKEIAELLIAKGADINAKDNSGYTPLDKAQVNHLYNVADLLRKHSSLLVQLEGFMGIDRMQTVIFIVLSMIILLFAFMDILKSDFKGNYKLIWLLVVIFFPLLGSLCYFFIGWKKKIKGKNQDRLPVK